MHSIRDMMLTHKFVFSPMGAGTDTYRHWESLLLGCIPVMVHSSLDHLFVDLPVLLIDDYRQLTPEYLTAVYPKFLKKVEAGEYNFDKLTQQYWLDLMRAHKKRK